MKISETLNSLLEKRQIPGGAYALFKGKDTIAKSAIGMGQFGKDLNVDSKVRVASISKLSTAIALLTLSQDKKIDLDYDCSPHLGFTLRHPLFPESPITPRMLLSHTSGIRDGDNYMGVIGETLEGFFVKDGVQYKDGEHWAKGATPLGGFCYSNLGMGVVAQIIENISGERFDKYVKRALFDVLNIDCGFNWSGISQKSVENSTPLYRRKNDGNEWIVQVDGDMLSKKRPTIFAQNGKSLDDYKIGTNGLLFSPQGGLRASINDLVKIAQVLMGYHGILRADTIENMRQIVWHHKNLSVQDGGEDGSFQAFGTGIHHLLKDDNCPIIGLKSDMLGHYGEAYGLLGGLWFEPKSQKGFVYFINGSLENPQKGHTGLFAIEEEIMQSACEDLGLVVK